MLQKKQTKKTIEMDYNNLSGKIMTRVLKTINIKKNKMKDYRMYKL